MTLKSGDRLKIATVAWSRNNVKQLFDWQCCDTWQTTANETADSAAI